MWNIKQNKKTNELTKQSKNQLIYIENRTVVTEGKEVGRMNWIKGFKYMVTEGN